jgi:hypothetical protein
MANYSSYRKVTSANIVDGTIDTLDIANGAVTGDKIPDGNIAEAKIGAGAVTSGKIATGAVGNTELANGAALANIGTGGVTTSYLQDNSVTGAKIGLGGDTQGDMMYFNGTDWVRLAKGNAGQKLEQNGSNAPEWEYETVVKTFVNAGQSGDQSVTSYRGNSTGNMTFINGTEIACGIPTNASNWHRVCWHSICDDQGPANPNGMGFAIFRSVGGGSWTRIIDQGSHANYYNQMGDIYWGAHLLCYVPVVNATQTHSYRIYADKHTNQCNFRVNCSIGDDLRRDGWYNSQLEIWEINTNKFTTINLGRY